MYSQYGDLFFKVIDLTRFEREAIWTPDFADLECIRTTLGMTVTYAPGGMPRLPSITNNSPSARDMLEGADGTAATLVGTPRGRDPGVVRAFGVPNFEEALALPGVPVGLANQRTGPETDADLRIHLMLPRKKLILWAYKRQDGTPIRWLESPRQGFTTDVSNGPQPLTCDVVAATGEPNSIAIHWQVQTDISPCPVGSDRLVLSHRWEVTHTHDENYYLTRVIDGQIRFNGAVMRLQGVRPDDVRAQFIHPIPIGFERKVPRCTQSMDGLTIRYTITDTDPTITFDPGTSGATRMQIIERAMTAVEWGI